MPVVMVVGAKAGKRVILRTNTIAHHTWLSVTLCDGFRRLVLL